MNLQSGQLAVVTGAASGIGFALAEALGARSLTVVLADVEAAALETAQAALRARGFDVQAHVCDVADAAAVDGLAQTVPMTPSDLANRVLAGIEKDEFLILTHPELNGQVRARLATVERATRQAA